MRSTAKSLCIALVVVASVGCGLDENIIVDAQSAIGQAEANKDLVNKRKAVYKTALSAAHPTLQKIAVRENLSAHFDKADSAIADVQQSAAAVAAFLKADKSGQQAEVIAAIEQIRTDLANADTLAQIPNDKLASWVKKVKDSAKLLSAAEKTLSQTDALIAKNLGQGGALAARVAQQTKAFPNKVGDLQKRVAAIVSDQRKMHVGIETCRSQCSGMQDVAGNFDIIVYEKALGQVEELAEGIDLQVDDLDERLGQLTESYELKVIGLKKVPTYQFYYVKYSWDNWSDFDTTSASAVGWRNVVEGDYFAMPADGAMVENGSEHELHIEDKQIVYKYFATTVETNNGASPGPKTAEVDEDTFYGYLEAARKLDAMQGKGSVITSYSPSRRQEDKEPVAFEMGLSLIVEQKLPGQYEDETSESPSAAGGAPLGTVGDPEYGRWVNHGGRRRWHFHDYLLLHWALSPSRHHYYYNDYNSYSGWRRTQGYDGHRYGSDGRRRARSYGASTVRGAGLRARGRGMGGGK